MSKHIWYSAEQDERRRGRARQGGQPLYEVYAKLEDGSVVLYTEMRSDDKPSNFDDAVYLGRGDYSHSGARIA